MKDLINNVERMTSIEIAEVTGKQHKNVMQTIRNMESVWEKISGLKFQLSTYKDPTGRTLPCYSLTKTECLSQIYTDSHSKFAASKKKIEFFFA